MLLVQGYGFIFMFKKIEGIFEKILGEFMGKVKPREIEGQGFNFYVMLSVQNEGFVFMFNKTGGIFREI